MRLRQVNTDHKWLSIPDGELAIYNGIDCLATAIAAKVELEEAADHEMLQFWEQSVWPLTDAVVAMQSRGLWIDAAKRSEYTTKVRAELAEVDAELLAAAPAYLSEPTPKYPNSLGSSQKVAKWLFEDLGFKVGKRSEGGKPSVDQESLLAIWRSLRKKDEPVKRHLENLLHRSRLKTITQRYLDFDVRDSRIYPTIKMIGTETGRFAYSDPPIQQWTAECKPMISAPTGYCLVGADYEQLEARIAAVLFKVSRDIEILQSGEDLHAVTAMETFAISQREWFDMDPFQRKGRRNYTKSFRYRIIYGGDVDQVGALGAKVFCPCHRHEHEPVVNLEPGTIITASQRFLSNRPEIERARWRLLDEVRKTRCLRNPLGRKRLFFGPVDAVKREIYNWPIQSTAADLINRATIKLHKQQLPLFMQWHDYLGAEVPVAAAEQTGSLIKSAMEAPCAEMGGYVFPVEVKYELPFGVEHELSELTNAA